MKYRRDIPPMQVQVKFWLPILEEILRNERYYASQRRNWSYVSRDDEEVCQRVADIVLEIAGDIKKRAREACPEFDFQIFIDCQLHLLEEITRNEQWFMHEEKDVASDDALKLNLRIADVVVASAQDILLRSLCETYEAA